MDDENHQEGDSITFVFIDRLCRIIFLNSGFKVQVENVCGESAYSSYNYQRGEDTITIDGSYRCLLVEDLPEELSNTVSDLAAYLETTFTESEWTTNIDWRNAVEYFEV